jgi:hypothetical protein
LNLARAMPIYSTRARTFERVVFADFWRFDSGRPNLGHNIRRLVQLERMAPAPA